MWRTTEYRWSEVYIVIRVAQTLSSGGGGGVVLSKAKTWDDLEKKLDKAKFTEKDKKKFLEVLVKVNGLDKTEIRELEDVKKKITIDHIKNTLTKVAPNVKVSINIKGR